MSAGQVFIDGFAWWSRAPGDETKPRPAPALLPANERRRAPLSVLMALHVAEQATAQAGAGRSALSSVFTSMHGDLEIVDALCRTLADEPSLLSPTRFHHSVHNAASGYWAIAAGSRAPSTALSAHTHSFGAGLLEALMQSSADARPVLLVAADTEVTPQLAPLVTLHSSRGLLALALVLAAERGERSAWRLDWRLTANATPASGAALPPALRALQAQAQADALPLIAALEGDGGASPGSALAIAVSPRQHVLLQLHTLHR